MRTGIEASGAPTARMGTAVPKVPNAITKAQTSQTVTAPEYWVAVVLYDFAIAIHVLVSIKYISLRSLGITAFDRLVEFLEQQCSTQRKAIPEFSRSW